LWRAPIAGADESAAKPEYFPQPGEIQRRIDAVLERSVTLEVVDLPLEQSFADIEHMIDGQVSFHFDTPALEDAGIGPDTQITGRFRNLPLRTVLRLLLAPHDLEIIQFDEVRLVTTKDKTDTKLFVRVYPVGDLLPKVPAAKEIAAPEQDHAKQSNTAAENNQQSSGFGGGARVNHADVVMEYGPYEDLILAITGTVAPATWELAGGPGSIYPVDASQSLVMSQT
jgi:hypothetical protein